MFIFLLAQETWRPRITAWPAGGAVIFPSQQHFAYELQGLTNGGLLTGTWETFLSSASEDRPWHSMTMTNPAPVASSAFFRVRATSTP